MIWLYNYLFLPLVSCVLPVAKIFVKKLSEGLEARESLFVDLERDLSKLDKIRPRMLVHSTSVGEWLQAEPIVKKLKEKNPQLLVIASFFSPSGYNFIKPNHEVIDVKTYLPLDTRKNAKRFLEIVRPEFWIISKLDVWANHLLEAKRRGIKVFLTCATLTKLSKRDKGISAIFHKKLYSKIDAMFPISDDDKSRLAKLYQGEMHVCGDTKYDLVISKAQQKKFVTPLRYDENDVVFIAGSIWSEGAKVLFPVLKKFLKKYANFKVILAPHDLSYVSEFAKDFADAKLYSEVKDGESPQVVVVDSIGQLSGLYGLAQIAYVGGGFGTDGLHNVVEPAVYGSLLFFGANFHSSYEAEYMVDEQVASVVIDSKQIEDLFTRFFGNDVAIAEQRKNCADFVFRNKGATAKIVAHIERILHEENTL